MNKEEWYYTDDAYNWWKKHYGSSTTDHIDKKTFKRVISKLLKRIMEHMREGETFFPQNNLGKFYIVRLKRNTRKKLVDWGESNKLKEQLIEEGKTPYKVLEKDKEGNVIRDNGGEKWLVYFTDDYYYRYKWMKKVSSVKNKSIYKFEPTRRNKVELTTMIKNDSDSFFKFREEM